MRPRARYRLLYWLPVVALVGGGYVADRRATALRVVRLSAELDGLSSRIAELESRPPQLEGGAYAGGSAAAPAPHSVEEAQPSLPPARVLGRGRTGAWLYTDVRLPDGGTRRYYIRTNAPPAQLVAMLNGIREDVRDCYYASSGPE